MKNSVAKELTVSQKEKAQGNYLKFTALNAISYGSLGDSVLILYALKLGGSDTLIAILVSFFYLTMPAMLLGKSWVSRLGTSRTFGYAWILRNLSPVFFLIAPVTQRLLSPEAGFFVLGLGVFLFFIFRTIGITPMTTLIGDISSQKDQGHFISRIWFWSNFSLLIIIIASAKVLGSDPDIRLFQYIFIFGGSIGLLSSSFLFKIPSSDRSRRSATQPFTRAIIRLRKDKDARRFFFTWPLAYSVMALIFPYAMLTLKRGYEFGDQQALLFSVLHFSGSILISLFNGMILDRVGPRPMMFIYLSGTTIYCILWGIAPAEASLFHLIPLFFLGGICASGGMASVNHYFLNSTPKRLRINSSIIINIASGLLTGLMSSIVAAGIFKIMHFLGYQGLIVYRTFFVFLAIYALFVLHQIYQLKPVSNRKIRDVLSILFSIRELRTLYTLQKATRPASEKETVTLVNRLGELGSDLSEETLQAYLTSPKFLIRAKAIQALRNIEFGETTEQLLIAELQRGEYTTAYLAADVLGEHHIQAAIPPLRQALHSEDIFLRGKAITALVRLKDRKSYDTIRKIFSVTINPRLLIHGGNALVEMQDSANTPLLLQKIMAAKLPENLAEELLFNLSELWNVGEDFYRLFTEFKGDSQIGLEQLGDYIENQTPASFRQKSVLLEAAQPENWPHSLNILCQLDQTALPTTVATMLQTVSLDNGCIENTSLNQKIEFCLLVILPASLNHNTSSRKIEYHV